MWEKHDKCAEKHIITNAYIIVVVIIPPQCRCSVATTATSTPTKQHYNDDDYRRRYETMLTKFNWLYRHVYTIHIHNHQSIYSRNHSRRRKISSISAHTHLMTAASVRPSVPTDRPPIATCAPRSFLLVDRRRRLLLSITAPTRDFFNDW